MTLSVIDQQFEPGTPQSALRGFLNAWAAHAWTTALTYVQITWRENLFRTEVQAEYELSQRYKNFLITHAEIGRAIFTSDPCIVDIEYTITFHLFHKHNPAQTKKFWARLICESGPYQHDPAGAWGVNPTSLLRDMQQEQGQ